MRNAEPRLPSNPRAQPAPPPTPPPPTQVHENDAATHAILEYCGGGSVARHLQSKGWGKGLTEQQAAPLVSQLCGALAHLHASGVTHRDVKPENVLYTDSSRRCIKLCDFGFAVCCGERKLRSVCGSPAYMAPELLARESYHGPPVDVWALGCFAYELLHGKPAFRGESMEQLQLRVKRVAHGAFDKASSAPARSFVRSLLQHDPMRRRAAADAAGHSWLTSPIPEPAEAVPAMPRRVAAPAGGRARDGGVEGDS